MKIVIFSDSHGNSEAVQTIFKKENGANVFIFLGDGIEELRTIQKNIPEEKLFAVRGNCDRNLRIPPEQLRSFEGKLVFFTHGDGYGVKFTQEALKQAAKQRGAEIVLFGHTHIPYYAYDEGMYFFNPGSVALPRQGVETYGLLFLQEGEEPRFAHKEVFS